MGTSFKKNGASILTVIGSLGVIGTAVLSVRSTLKANDIFKKIKDEDSEKKRKDALKELIPIYIPAIACGAITISCIICANVHNKKQKAALASAYIMVENAYNEYRKKIKEQYGEEVDFNIKHEVSSNSINDVIMATKSNRSYVIKDILDEIDSSDKILFYDEISDRHFVSTIANVIKAEYFLNNNLVTTGQSSVNLFYDLLGIDNISGYDDVGWSICDCNSMVAELYWIDFVHKDLEVGDGLKVIMIHTIVPPSLLT